MKLREVIVAEKHNRETDKTEILGVFSTLTLAIAAYERSIIPGEERKMQGKYTPCEVDVL